MSETSSKIHLKIGEIEISIEGTPEFVAKQYQQMEKELNLNQKLRKPVEESTDQKEEAPIEQKAAKSPGKTRTRKTEKSLNGMMNG